MRDFGELEFKPQSLSMAGSGQQHSFLFPTQFLKTLLNVLPRLKSCEISYKIWISRSSIKMESSMPTLKPHFSHGNIQAELRRGCCPFRRWPGPMASCCPHRPLRSAKPLVSHTHLFHHFGKTKKSSRFQNLRFMIYTLLKSLKSYLFSLKYFWKYLTSVEKSINGDFITKKQTSIS